MEKIKKFVKDVTPPSKEQKAKENITKAVAAEVDKSNQEVKSA